MIEKGFFVIIADKKKPNISNITDWMRYILQWKQNKVHHGGGGGGGKSELDPETELGEINMKSVQLSSTAYLLS